MLNNFLNYDKEVVSAYHVHQQLHKCIDTQKNQSLMLQFLGMIYILLRTATILSMFTPRVLKYPIKISFEKSPQIISSIQGIFIKCRKTVKNLRA